MRSLAMLLAVMSGLLSWGPATAQQASGSGKRIFCWTDEQGQRACGDRVPPEYAQQERQIYNSQGRVVEIRERQRTAEELAELERQQQEALAERRRAEEQRAYDQFLLSTFNSVRDLERMRDQRLATLDGRIRLAQQAIDEDEAALAKLRDQAARAEASGKSVPERVSRQIGEFERGLTANRQGLEQMRAERAHIETRFAADAERLRTLRAAAGLPPT